MSTWSNDADVPLATQSSPGGVSDVDADGIPGGDAAVMTHPEAFAVDRTGQDPAAMVLRLSGELDIVGGAVLECEIALALESRPGEIILDLSDLVFLDAGGVGVIAGGIARARRQGTTVAARAPRGIVRRVLRLTGFDSVLSINDESATAAGTTNVGRPAGASTGRPPAPGGGPKGVLRHANGAQR